LITVGRCLISVSEIPEVDDDPYTHPVAWDVRFCAASNLLHRVFRGSVFLRAPQDYAQNSLTRFVGGAEGGPSESLTETCLFVSFPDLPYM